MTYSYELHTNTAVNVAMNDIMRQLESEQYEVGYNAHLGDDLTWSNFIPTDDYHLQANFLFNQ
jgi:hypothetical protein